MSGIITTRTSDLIAGMAQKLQAIASTIYEAGYRDEARELENAAYTAANVAVSIDGKIAAAARVMMADEPKGPQHDQDPRHD